MRATEPRATEPGRLDFSEPSPILKRTDSEELRKRILSITQQEAHGLSIGKSTLHYLRKNASNRNAFRAYSKTLARLEKT